MRSAIRLATIPTTDRKGRPVVIDQGRQLSQSDARHFQPLGKFLTALIQQFVPDLFDPLSSLDVGRRRILLGEHFHELSARTFKIFEHDLPAAGRLRC